MANSNPSFILQEIEIVLGTPQQDPTFFNLDFLTYTGIVLDEWELSENPRQSPQLSEVNFTNDVSLKADPQRTVFTEFLGEKGMEDIAIPYAAMRFLDIMKNLNVVNLGIHFRGYVAFLESPLAAHEYFCTSLFNPGAWQMVGTAPLQAGLDLVYTLGDRKLNFTVRDSRIQRVDESAVSALVFAGEFASSYATIEPQDRWEEVRNGIQVWDRDLRQFIDVVSRFFQTAPPPPPPVQEEMPTTVPLG